MENITTATFTTMNNDENVTNITEVVSTKLPVTVVAEDYLMYKLGVGIHTYYLPVVVIVGLVGNILSLSVMMQPHNRRISCCVYMGALAVIDTCLLYIAIHYWMVTGPVRTMYEWECKAIATSFHVSIMLLGSFTVNINGIWF